MAPEIPADSLPGSQTAPRRSLDYGGARVSAESGLSVADRRGERRTALVQALLAFLTLLFCQAMTRQYGADMVLTCGVFVLLVNAFARYRLAGMKRMPERVLDYLTVLDLLVAVCMLWSIAVTVAAAKGVPVEAPSIGLLVGLVAARILRTHPRPIIIAGVTGALGWLLAITALSSDVVATAHRIALWTEIERIVGMVTIASILAVAAYRTRRLIVAAFALTPRSIAEKHPADMPATMRDIPGDEAQSIRLAAAMDTINIGLVVIDAQNHVVSVNEPFRHLHGIDVPLEPRIPIADLIANLGKGLPSAD